MKDLIVPEAQILEQSCGDMSEALRLAAVFGYRSACQDLDKFTSTPSSFTTQKND